MVGRSYIKPRDQIAHFHEKFIHTWLKYAQKSDEHFWSSWDEDSSSVHRCFGSRWGPITISDSRHLDYCFPIFCFLLAFFSCYQYSRFHSTPSLPLLSHIQDL